MGWVLLGGLCLFMLLLFAGLVRYIRGGRPAKQEPTPAPDLDFVYEDDEEE